MRVIVIKRSVGLFRECIFFFKQKHCSVQEKMVLSHSDTLCMSFKQSKNLLLCDPIFLVTIVKPVLSDHSKRRTWFSQICPGPK